MDDAIFKPQVLRDDMKTMFQPEKIVGLKLYKEDIKYSGADTKYNYKEGYFASKKGRVVLRKKGIYADGKSNWITKDNACTLAI